MSTTQLSSRVVCAGTNTAQSICESVRSSEVSTNGTIDSIYIRCHQHPQSHFFLQTKANTSTLTKTLQRFHDHHNHQSQPNNEYGTRRIRHNRRTKAKATTKAMIQSRPSLWLPKPFDAIMLSKPSHYINLRDLPTIRSSLALNIIRLLEVE